MGEAGRASMPSSWAAPAGTVTDSVRVIVQALAKYALDHDRQKKFRRAAARRNRQPDAPASGRDASHAFDHSPSVLISSLRFSDSAASEPTAPDSRYRLT